MQPEISIDVGELRKLLSTFWFRSVFSRLSPAWRDRLLAVLVEQVTIPNYAIKTGRRTVLHLSELTDAQRRQVLNTANLPDAIRADFQLVVTVAMLWGEDAVKRLALTPASDAPGASTLSSLLQTFRQSLAVPGDAHGYAPLASASAGARGLLLLDTHRRFCVNPLHPMMGLLAKWVARGLLVLVALAVLALGVIYAGSERILRRHHAAPLDTALRLPPSRKKRGRRHATNTTCMRMSRQDGQGLTTAGPGVHRITAPSLTEVLPTYTDGELVRLLRYGVRRDGTTALLMPADTSDPMSDEHIGEIVNFLRRQPVVSGPPRVRQLSLKARLGILLGKYPLSVVGVDPSSPRWGAGLP